MIERRWRRLFWLLLATAIVHLLLMQGSAIAAMAMGDIDDDMRLAQVQSWLAGQGWFDLRQHRIDPPVGLDMHWTRIVDLPIAGLILFFRPLLGGLVAQQIACTVAPLLALAVALRALIVATRRLIAPGAYPLAFAILMCAQAALYMWSPLRIDHHGWQLATLMLVVAGLADPQQRRGGVTVGLATALSLGIGLELLPSMAIAGASLLWRWAWNRDQAPRLRAYAVSLSGGCTIAFAGFASDDNRRMLCDALSPVYLSAVLATGALLVLLASAPIERRRSRIELAIVTGVVLVAVFAQAFPQCLGRPEALSPEAERLWFRTIPEVQPLLAKPWRIALDAAALPLIGVAGTLFAWWRARAGERAAAWGTVAMLSLFSTAMLGWQSRYVPQAQLLGVLGATALGWTILPRLLGARSSPVRIAGPLLGFLAVSGLIVHYAIAWAPDAPAPGRHGGDMVARAACMAQPALRQLDALPPATILAPVDMGPRLIAMTHHRAVAAPYHRNGAPILAVQRAFLSPSPETAHALMRRHGATLLLLCPGLAETMRYTDQAPAGFAAQLEHAEGPLWLSPVELPTTTPYRLWKRRD